MVLSVEIVASDCAGSIANFKYDRAKVRELTAHMTLYHEYPFMQMDDVIFNKFMRANTPYWQKITRTTIKNDCISAYEIEKKKLKTLFKSINKVNITTDMWKSSNQKIGYMVVTGQFIDSDWNLQKRVLNFFHVPPPHSGVIVADALQKCFIEWGIEDKFSTIIVDNAKYYDVALRILKDKFTLKKKLSFGGRIFHVRCCAHIINLLVLRWNQRSKRYIYPEAEANRNIVTVKQALYEIYNEYVVTHAATHTAQGEGGQGTTREIGSSSASGGDHDIKKTIVTGSSLILGHVSRTVDTIQPSKSDLDIYLDESAFICAEGSANKFDIMEWWKANTLKFHILSKMARDILSIRITSVASESTFSAGGRVIDPYRTSLLLETVQVLLCGADWVRALHRLKKGSKDRVLGILDRELSTLGNQMCDVAYSCLVHKSFCNTLVFGLQSQSRPCKLSSYGSAFPARSRNNWL
ncbi:hypothetical protein F0562_012101 [Nyssa sinensis]|uniref:HAT C-terminal dimerisation domain-containing protein n=1 Tax=Nyssa sinensis TaxID=561372 RepID=A0A5J4ZWD8_9ASTE|nr:hypothetical protein F0562_012101 [Nyssa sinensis]